jgi:hypothetical protein
MLRTLLPRLRTKLMLRRRLLLLMQVLVLVARAWMRVLVWGTMVLVWGWACAPPLCRLLRLPLRLSPFRGRSGLNVSVSMLSGSIL